MKKSEVLILGGGPAGSIAALSLLKLGHQVKLYERLQFPRYRVGESFLPGTMSILDRLGMKEQIDAAGFVKKPSATFLWGEEQAPWTFSFAVPRASGWIYDHAIQVKREEFDKMLLEEVKRRGGMVHEGWSVRDVNVDHADFVEIEVEGEGKTQTVRGDYLIDGSGLNSVLVKKLECRRFDEFYRSLAVWSYFRCPERYQGDLKGTTYSITFRHGWCWMIPLKGDLYSVGVIVDQSQSAEIQRLGLDQFYRETLATCKRAMKILGDAEQVDEVRIVKDWSYDTTVHSRGRFFLSGDAACFTDPLFSQGVHLAAQSAVSAAAAIDRLSSHPEEAGNVHRWYGKSYGLTFEQYHEFLASFYTFASFTEPESEFWNKRRIAETNDQRLERRRWFSSLVEKTKRDSHTDIADFRDRASSMIAIGKHSRPDLHDDFRDAELVPKRMEWISQLTRRLNALNRIEWQGRQVVLEAYYKVNPESFVLEPKFILANEQGQSMTKYAVTPEVGQIFHEMLETEMDYKSLIKRMNEAGAGAVSSQIVVRLFEAGLLKGFDRSGEPVLIQDRLRFDGVGVEYEV